MWPMMESSLKHGLTGLWAWGLLTAVFAYPNPGTPAGKAPTRSFIFPDDPSLLNATTTREQTLVGLNAFETRVGIVSSEKSSLVVPRQARPGTTQNGSEVRWSSERTITAWQDAERGQNLFSQRESSHATGPIRFPETPAISEKGHWPADETRRETNRVASPLSPPGWPTAPNAENKPAVSIGDDSFFPDCSSVDEARKSLYGICSTVLSYPEDLIQKEIERQYGGEASQYFFDKSQKIPSDGDIPVFRADEFLETEDQSELEVRVGIPPEPTDTPLCSYDTTPLRVQAAKNTNDTWRVIVNDKRYVQTVYAEMCRNHGKPCEGLKDVSFPLGTEPVCKQKYTSRRLLAVKKADKPTAEGSKELVTVMEYFRLPSCCVCYLRKTLGSLVKSGATRR